MRLLAWPLAAASLLLTPALLAQPVLTVRVGEGAVAEASVARVASAVGADAQHGSALTASLVRRFGRVVPAGDPLRTQREAVGPLVQGYYGGRSGRAAARRGLTALVDEMARVPDALELVEENRAAYLRALMLLALDAREEGPVTRADPWLRRVLDFDRAWQPPPAEWPPALRAQLDQARGGAAPTGEGRLVVRVAREGCSATVDGRASGESVRVGSHRVAVTCVPNPRVRVVEVVAGATVTVTIDPRLDAALDLSATPGLRYATESERAANVTRDAAAVGAALEAPRVVTVDDVTTHVIDASPARAAVEAATQAPDLAVRLGAALRGERAVVVAPVVTPPPRRGPGAAPWVLVGVGGAAVVAGGALLAASFGALGDVETVCPGYRCGALDAAQRTSAQESYDRARTLNTAGWVTLGVGAAAAVGGVVWYALASRRSDAPVVTAVVTGEGASVGVSGRF
jgi:hypothetical protein